MSFSSWFGEMDARGGEDRVSGCCVGLMGVCVLAAALIYVKGFLPKEYTGSKKAAAAAGQCFLFSRIIG